MKEQEAVDLPAAEANTLRTALVTLDTCATCGKPENVGFQDHPFVPRATLHKEAKG